MSSPEESYARESFFNGFSSTEQRVRKVGTHEDRADSAGAQRDGRRCRHLQRSLQHAATAMTVQR